jgi:hypothetical protein
VAAFGALFPIKELTARKEKLRLFEEIRVQLQICSSSQSDTIEPERTRMREMLWQAMERTLDLQ